MGFAVTRRYVTLLSLTAAAVLTEQCFASFNVGKSRKAQRRPLQRPRSAGAFHVTDFGATGDGESDDSAAIAAADAAASAAGKPLFFREGVYLTEPVRATTSWIGEDRYRSTIRYRGRSADFTNLVVASGIDGIRFVDLAFDGNVSADPVSWDASNYDRFTGAAGLSIESCRNAQILRCKAMNTRAHGFRFLKVRSGKLESCSTDRSRGVYGDGFLILSSIDISIAECISRDYTRIGIAIDRTDITEPFCQRIIIRKYRSNYGHHASALYGATEFNAGIWMENCAGVLIEDVHTQDNSHRGISVCSGKRTSDLNIDNASIIIRDCKTEGGTFGICVYSLIDLPIAAMITRCTVKHALIAFQGAANTGADRVTWIECHADYDASAGNGRGFATEVTSAVHGTPVFTVGQGCTISRWAEDPVKLADAGPNAATADIGGYYYPAGPMRLNVNGVREVSQRPIYIRWYNDQAHAIHLRDVDAFISRGSPAGATVFTRNVNVRMRPGAIRFQDAK